MSNWLVDTTDFSCFDDGGMYHVDAVYPSKDRHYEAKSLMSLIDQFDAERAARAKRKCGSCGRGSMSADYSSIRRVTIREVKTGRKTTTVREVETFTHDQIMGARRRLKRRNR